MRNAETFQIELRIENAAKRVQIVTEHAGALGGKRVNELAVAVIADVEEIELVAHIPPREAGIIAQMGLGKGPV